MAICGDVDEISPNPSGLPGFGGIQLQLSSGLRGDAALFHAFDEQIRLDPAGDHWAQYE